MGHVSGILRFGSAARRTHDAASLLCALLVAASTVRAQSGPQRGELRGRVFLAGDTVSLGGAEIEVVGEGIRFSARRDGSYQLRGLRIGRHELRVRLIGLASRTLNVEISGPEVRRFDIAMSRLPHTLREVRINGVLRMVPPRFDDVYRRMKTAHGVFFTREEIEKLNPLDVLSILHHVPMAHVSDQGVWFSRCVNSGARIGEMGKVQIYIDGFRATGSFDEKQSDILKRVIPSQIQAIEVYSSTSRIPGEFLNDACAVIAIWTR